MLGLLVASQAEARPSGRVVRIVCVPLAVTPAIEAIAGGGSGLEVPGLSPCGHAPGRITPEGRWDT